jgi:hypothetical protein
MIDSAARAAVVTGVSYVLWELGIVVRRSELAIQRCAVVSSVR